VKTATYNETVEIVTAQCKGKLKALLTKKCMSPDCAKQRISRFRREHPEDYKRILKRLKKCHLLSLHKR